MQGLWLEDQRLSYRQDLPRPTAAPGEALIRVTLAGVCGTDVELLRGYVPFTGVPGHEFVGQVVSAPDEPWWEGQRVVGEINAVCADDPCATCRAGRPRHCEQRTVLGIVGRDGAFARWLTLPLANLHAVPESVSDEAAVFCEPLAAALRIQQQVQLGPEHRVLLLGAGRLGQLVAQTLALTGCQLQVVARHPEQQQLLREQGIVTVDEGAAPRRWADVAVEATGSPAGFDAARQAVRPGGTLVLKSTYASELKLNVSSLVVDEITLVASRCGPFAAALELISVGQVDPTVLVQARYPLAQGAQALAHAARPGALKVLLTF